MRRSLLISLATGFVLVGCATQEPAPIVTGTNAQQPIRIGEPSSRELSAEEQASFTNRISGQQQYQAPTTQPPAIATQSMAQASETYFVQPGDKLSQIASHFRVSAKAIAQRNNLQEGDILRAGQVLIIPMDGKTTTADQLALPESRSTAAASRGSFTERFTSRTRTETTPTVEEQRLVADQQPPAPVEDKIVREQQPAPVSENRSQAEQGYTYYRVQQGDNLFRIGLKYNMTALDLMDVNEISRPEELQAGQLIKIPLQREPTARTVAQNERIAKAKGPIWPVEGPLLYRFGEDRRGVEYTGIAIQANAGTPVLATAEGNVIYAAGGLKSYGNLVLIRHSDGLISAYGHMADIQVVKSQYVRKGQVLGTVGQSGNATQPQLHFELRRKAQAVDPLKILPSQPAPVVGRQR